MKELFDAIFGDESFSDVPEWYLHQDTCPNCGIDLNELRPESNLYPHFTGGCKDGEDADG